MTFQGRAGSAPHWYQAKIIADWMNCSVMEAEHLPLHWWLRAAAGKWAEVKAEQELERREKNRMPNQRQLGAGR